MNGLRAGGTNDLILAARFLRLSIRCAQTIRLLLRSKSAQPNKISAARPIVASDERVQNTRRTTGRIGYCVGKNRPCRDAMSRIVRRWRSRNLKRRPNRRRRRRRTTDSSGHLRCRQTSPRRRRLRASMAMAACSMPPVLCKGKPATDENIRSVSGEDLTSIKARIAQRRGGQPLPEPPLPLYGFGNGRPQ